MLLNTALNLSIRQSEVDFVIPNLREDLRLYVDPFLFYKSGNPDYNEVHSVIHTFFARCIGYVQAGKLSIVQRMLSFPEVESTMLGFSRGNHAGRGMGTKRDEIIYNEIVANKDIQAHGIRHLSEMQLLIMDIGFDMVSDMCTNIAKLWFVNYTQNQCRLHDIPLESDVCLEHVFDWDEDDWDDVHADLPLNPLNGQPILFVPKAVVRRFEEIDYKDFWNTTYRYILRETEVQKSLQSIGREPKISWTQIAKKYNFCKQTVVDVLHEQPELKRKYLDIKERNTTETTPPTDLSSLLGGATDSTPPDDLIAELHAITPGNDDAKKYEKLMLRILTRLFSPPLMHPKEQVYSLDGREIKDITFYNAATHGFWHDVKQKHGSLSIPFELKNMTDIGNPEVFQIAARLNDAQGMLGILVSRNKDDKDDERALRRLHNKREYVLILTDADIIQMLTDVKNGMNQTMRIQRIYRDLVEGA